MSARHVGDLRYNGPLTHRLRSIAADRETQPIIKLIQKRKEKFRDVLQILIQQQPFEAQQEQQKSFGHEL